MNGFHADIQHLFAAGVPPNSALITVITAPQLLAPRSNLPMMIASFVAGSARDIGADRLMLTICVAVTLRNIYRDNNHIAIALSRNSPYTALNIAHLHEPCAIRLLGAASSHGRRGRRMQGFWSRSAEH